MAKILAPVDGVDLRLSRMALSIKIYLSSPEDLLY